MTWAPALAGFIVAGSGQDEELARSLHQNPVVFDSREHANTESDRYRQIADTLWMISILATDSGEEPLQNKFKGALVQVAAVNVTYVRTNTAKAVIDRDEPIPDSGDAFPSNHATGSFAHATLIRENMKATRLPPSLAWGYTAAGYVAATGSAWGRVEAGGHHVSDQLLSAALGNFTALFINSLFMGETSGAVAVHARPDEVMVTLTVPF